MKRISTTPKLGGNRFPVAELKKRLLGNTCEFCGNPGVDHFRGNKLNRFEGCEAARIRAKEKEGAKP